MSKSQSVLLLPRSEESLDGHQLDYQEAGMSVSNDRNVQSNLAFRGSTHFGPT